MQGYLISTTSYNDSIVAPIIINRFKDKIDCLGISPEYHRKNEIFVDNILIGDIERPDIVFLEESLEINNIFDSENAKKFSLIKKQYPCFTKDDLKIISGKPVILIVGLGRYCQQTNIELMLNDMMTKNGIKVFQHFSKKIYISDPKNSLGDDILQMNSDCLHSDLSIIGIECDGLSELYSHELYNIIYSTKPDYLILCIENRNVDYEKIINVCKIRFGIEPKSIIISDYFGFSDNYIDIPIYDRPLKKIYIRNSFLNSHSKEFEEHLYVNIINTVTGIKKWASII